MNTTLIYSKKIGSFISEIHAAIRSILANELNVRVTERRFFNKAMTFSYPIKVVVFNDKNILGYFDSQFYELGFHERLMHGKKEQLHNVIRHELAHYILFVEQGEPVTPHSPLFRSFCKQRGWGEEVFQSACPLEVNPSIDERQDSVVLRKIKKLLALSHSRHVHEAEMAIIKSQQLLLKHQVDTSSLETEDVDDKMCLKRIMKFKRGGAKIKAITQILSSFWVHVVHHRGNDGFTYLEILGTKENVEVADYIAAVLDRQLDQLWEEVHAKVGLHGQVAKNSFLLGIARGYCKKIDALNIEHNSHMTQSLIVIMEKLIYAKSLAYPHLSTKKSRTAHCQNSSALGEEVGKKLTFNKGVTLTNNKKLLT